MGGLPPRCGRKKAFGSTALGRGRKREFLAHQGKRVGGAGHPVPAPFPEPKRARRVVGVTRPSERLHGRIPVGPCPPFRRSDKGPAEATGPGGRGDEETSHERRIRGWGPGGIRARLREEPSRTDEDEPGRRASHGRHDSAGLGMGGEPLRFAGKGLLFGEPRGKRLGILPLETGVAQPGEERHPVRGERFEPHRFHSRTRIFRRASPRRGRTSLPAHTGCGRTGGRGTG
jgi:hypothetical protein